MNFKRFYLIALVIACPFSAFAQWTDGQSAVNVIFQPDFISGNPGTTAQNVQNAVGIAIDSVNNKLYVGDYGNSRVLRFAYPITSNQPTAELVFGQTNFTANTQGNAADKMGNPWDLAVDSSGNLYVVDISNHRILVYDVAHTIATNGPAANRVLGQTAFGVGTSGLAANRMNGPRGLHVDSVGSLWVTEISNHRILRFDNVDSKVTGASADFVLGQTNFTSSASGSGQNKVNQPNDAYLIGTSLFVSDAANNRVLRFDSVYTKTNGSNAEGVLFQPNFSSVGAGLSQSQISTPVGLTADRSGRLYVNAQAQHRVLIFNNAVSKSNGANADNVLGQLNFTSSTAGNGAQKLNDTYYSVVDETNNRLLINESNGHRTMIFQASSPLPVSVSGFSIE